MNNQDLLATLNDEQRAAVCSQGTHLLVIAGPGTGKTRVLVSRIFHLLNEGTRPEGILAVTFTNKAASEIKERLSRLGLDRLPFVGTFHSWAYSLVLNSTKKRPYVMGEDEQRQLLREALEAAGIKGRDKGLKDRLLLLKQQYKPKIDEAEGELLALWESYHALLSEYDVMDYDDLIIRAVEIVEKNGSGYLSYVLVDEFQDVSQLQFHLVRLLARSSLITAIGDANQAIYGFRGASPRFMERFRNELGPVETVCLSKAYRCPQRILDAASSFIGEDSGLVSQKGTGEGIVYKCFENEEREAAWIAGQIDRLVGGTSFESLNAATGAADAQRSLSDVCILYRARFMSEPLVSALLRQGIPFHTPFRQRRKVSRLFFAIRHLAALLEGRTEDFHIKMLGIKKKEAVFLINQLKEAIEQGSLQDEFLKQLEARLNISVGDQEKQKLREIIGLLRSKAPLSLIFKEEQDELDFSVEAVTLMTLHASKGLEFPIVFLCGLDQDVLPWKDSDLDEERRLFYVGLTRSAEHLFLTSSKRRKIYGRRVETGPSAFLTKINDYLHKDQQKANRKKPSLKKKQKSLF